MTSTVFLAVIAAALLHAGWNALLKGGDDKHLNMSAVVFGHAPFAAVGLIVSPMPDPSCWPYVLAGTLLHVGYQFFLLTSYRFGDLTQVYPIARGSAPLIVAAVSVLVLGVELPPLALLAVCTIAAGILSLGLVRREGGQRNATAAGLALVTGCFIAGYSLNDGMGARVAGTALGFYCWVTIGNLLVFGLLMRWYRPGTLRQIVPNASRMAVVGGGASFVAYAMVTWAFTQAPITMVTALRETSIVFALLIGVTFMGEKLNLMKVLATMITLCGAVLLRLSKT